MFIDDEKLDSYTDKISEEIRKKSWEDVTFLIKTILSPKNSFYDVSMGSFISKAATYFIEQYRNHPERVAYLPELIEQWVGENERKLCEVELTECHTALACIFQKKEDKEKTEKYYKKAENLVDQRIEKNGEFWDYADKAYLFLRFKKYEDIPGLLKKMQLLAAEDYEEERCNDIEECYREESYYFYHF